MIKKQTIWLLTMLSLMVVLSVYYIMSDGDDLAYMQTDDDSDFQMTLDELSEEDIYDDINVEDISTLGMSELFATLRMEIDDERSLKKERLQDIIASSQSSTVEINEAMNEINELDTISTKEKILQETILSAYEQYEDVLVRAEEDKVHVHVITDQLPREEAVQIMQLVYDELGERTVDIHFQDK